MPKKIIIITIIIYGYFEGMEIQKYDYTNVGKKVSKIIQIAQIYLKDDKDLIESEIQKAYIYARDAHEGQFRHSGDPYILHPVESCIILMDLNPDLHTIQACLLHDVIEDTPKDYGDIEEDFGKEVAYLCGGMEKLSKVKYKGEERTIGSLRKMFVAMSEDIRVIFIKLSDRLHNMRTLKFHPKKEKQQRIALETLNIYSPIADRLGLHKIKNLLDEECFKILNQYDYNKVKKELSTLSGSMKEFRDNAKKEIDKLLIGTGVNYEVQFRVKSIYSIHNKMLKKGIESASDLYDIYGIKILVPDIENCYRVLGIIHNTWTPLPNRFKDYIALPKPNGYQSLHTTVVGLLEHFRKQPTEIQIKTFEMDLKSDIGVAAHFEYKEKGSKVANDINWVKQLKELTSSLENNDFIDSLQIDLFKDRIFVLSPKGDSVNLPAGSTPIDFAYEIHTDLGNHIVAAKVNGAIYPIDKELKNGDVIEIVTDRNKKPNPFFISVVKTIKAKNNIRAFLKKEDSDLHLERGKDIFNNLLEKLGLERMDKDFTFLKQFDGRVYNVIERKQILEQFGSFTTNPQAILRKILKEKKINILEKEKKQKLGPKSEEITDNKQKVIIIGGEKNIPYKIGTCCESNLSDKIVAYANAKGQVVIHNRDCIVLSRLQKDRLLTAYYQGEEVQNITFDLDLVVLNKIGMLKDISKVAFDMNINISEIVAKKQKLNHTLMKLVLETEGYDYLIIDRFIERIRFVLNGSLIEVKINKVSDN